MFCCERCFDDLELKAMIKSRQNKGGCDFCHSKGVWICNLDNDNDFREQFEKLIDMYDIVKDDEGEVLGDVAPLEKQLCTNWDIFSELICDKNNVKNLIIHLLSDRYDTQPDFFDKDVAVVVGNKKSYFAQYSMLGELKWEAFVDQLKYENRFHTNVVNYKVLDEIIRQMRTPVKKGTLFFRSRISKDNKICEKMGAPPKGVASEGRANSEGVSRLYLADSIDTALCEIRANMHDCVTVAEFESRDNIELIDLTRLNTISPFRDIDINLLYVNRDYLKSLNNEVSKPMRRNDSRLDYLSTQFVVDYIKSKGYDGVKYKSVMHNGGINYAMFDENKFKCKTRFLCHIKEVKYERDEY